MGALEVMGKAVVAEEVAGVIECTESVPGEVVLGTGQKQHHLWKII